MRKKLRILKIYNYIMLFKDLEKQQRFGKKKRILIAKAIYNL